MTKCQCQSTTKKTKYNNLIITKISKTRHESKENKLRFIYYHNNNKRFHHCHNFYINKYIVYFKGYSFKT